MTGERFRVNELVKYNYSEIGEYIDENHTDRPLRNDEVVKLLNEQHETIHRLKQNIDELLKLDVEEELLKENEQLRNRLKDWHKRTFKAHEYFNTLEKVIDEVCDDDISNQIWKEYEKRERLIE